MSKNYRQNSLISFVALFIILYFIGFPLVFSVICGIFGSPAEIISNVINLIPFGEAILDFAAKIISSITGQAFSYQTTQGALSFSYVLGELSKSIFTVIVFELLDLLAGIAMNLGKKPDGR